MEKLFGARKSDSGLQFDSLTIGDLTIPRITGEFWTSRQRQASSLHEISYRACFKAQLPAFFIERFTAPGEVVYDPFMGRGTTTVEAALRSRVAWGNDANPLSKILSWPRLNPPLIEDVERRLSNIRTSSRNRAAVDLSMFFHSKTESEIVSLRRYLFDRRAARREDGIDKWIRMVATNRLTGHSKGFFSVYTLPPNQALSAKNQKRINKLRRQKPEYRDVRALIVRKTRSLLRDITENEREVLHHVAHQCRFTNTGADRTRALKSSSVHLSVTSPPFLDVVNYAQDNWLRCWFNGIDLQEVQKRLTVVRSLEDWVRAMGKSFDELYRLCVPGGFVAFEVGEIRRRNLRLDEVVVPVGVGAGFSCIAVMINQQDFTKTSNIWGISNNRRGTNTNRIALFQKPVDEQLT